MENTIKSIIGKYNNDRTRLMDILTDIQNELGHVSDEAMQVIAHELGISKVEVEQTHSFYHFFTKEPRGKYTVYLNDSTVSNMMGRAANLAMYAMTAPSACMIPHVLE